MSTDSPDSEKPAPAAIAAEQDALAPGTRFGELEILRVLGVGGFGIVYLARDHSLERDVALKEYMPASLAVRGQGAQITVRSGALGETYAMGLRSFVNEARLLAKFDHPSLVKVYRFWEDNATAYMVMPFLQGRTLREARRAMDAPPDEAWVRGVLEPILGALEVLHRDGVFHRDIAPDNILLPHEGPPVLLDFGAARRVIGDRTQSLTAILKPSYAPIEQYAEMTALRQGPWTDLYALGAVVHFLLAGMPPTPATARAVQDEMQPLWTRRFAGVSPAFLAAIDWALAVRPQERPQSVEALCAVLEGRAEPPSFARTLPGSTSLMPVGDAPARTGYEPTQAATRAEPTFQPTQRLAAATVTSAPSAAPPTVSASPPAAAASSPAVTGSRKGLVGAALAVVAVLAAAGGWQWLESQRPGAPVVAAAPPAAPPAPVIATPTLAPNVAPAVDTTSTTPAAMPAALAPAPEPASAAAPLPERTQPPAAVPAVARPGPIDRVSRPPTRAPATPAAAEPAAPETVTTDESAERPANPIPHAETRAERARALREAMRAQRQAAQEAQAGQMSQGQVQPANVPLGTNPPGTTPLGAAPPGTVPLGAAPVGPATAREACGGRVLVALWNCMQRECRRPRYAQQAECLKINEERRAREFQ